MDTRTPDGPTALSLHTETEVHHLAGLTPRGSSELRPARPAAVAGCLMGAAQHGAPARPVDRRDVAADGAAGQLA
jgi:hypothetical protein